MSDTLPPSQDILLELASLRSEVRELRAARDSDTKAGKEWRKRGRAIRRLVSLTDSVTDLLAAADRRGAAETATNDFSAEENRAYNCYKELRRRIPTLFAAIEGEAPLELPLEFILHELNEGADAARADDTTRLKRCVVSWVTEPTPAELALHADHKYSRGFRHQGTGRLLCPVEYNWNCLDQRQKIRDIFPDFVVTANSWPQFLYENLQYDPEEPAKGLFKGDLLGFKVIFTSPTSVNEELVPTDHPTCWDDKRTRSHVAQILDMRKVTPRAIAYISVQVRFALSSAPSWRLKDGPFEYDTFYNTILRWFEDTDGPEEKAFIDDLLLWWNRKIFGPQAALQYQPQNLEKTSVAASFLRRCPANNPIATEGTA